MFNKKKKKKCEHEWIAGQNVFILNQDGKEYPRLFYVCKKCGVAEHKPVYNQSVLKKMEKKEEDEEE